MTPLDAMRRLAAHGLRDAHRGVCAVCEQWWTREDPGACPEIVHHLPDCPVPHLAGVVAALEAAEKVTEGEFVPTGDVDQCCFCGTFDHDVGIHTPSCDWQTFRTALKGGA